MSRHIREHVEALGYPLAAEGRVYRWVLATASLHGLDTALDLLAAAARSTSDPDEVISYLEAEGVPDA